jgi:hypothetical protein
LKNYNNICRTSISETGTALTAEAKMKSPVGLSDNGRLSPRLRPPSPGRKDPGAGQSLFLTTWDK